MTDLQSTQRLFFKTLFEDLDGYIELRGISRNGKPAIQKWYDNVEALLEALAKMPADQAGYDIYFGVLPRATEDGTKTGIREAWTAWVDIDTDIKQAEKLIDQYPLPWVAKIKSGNGLHCYWRLKEPYPLETPEQIAEYESRLRRLAVAMGGDLAACDITRIMRVPGTINMKGGE